MPLISVIVPVYKVEAYLARCVDSILDQSFSDFELILVDDGSPDSCGALCDAYAKKDARIVVIHQKNGGLSAARNAGIDWAFAHSDSQWLNFIDSDDWVHPEYLERLLNAAMEQNVSVSACGYASTEGREPTIVDDELSPVLWEPEAFYLEHNVNATVAWGKLYRREHFRSIRYPFGKINEDEFVTYQILFPAQRIAVIQAPLYNYYVNPTGIMQSRQGRLREDKFEAFEQQIRYFKKNGFKDACRCQVRMYLLIVYKKIQALSNELSAGTAEPGAAEFLKNMKRRRRKHFSAYARLLNPTEENSDGWVLTKIFPKRMKFYWRYRAALRKLKLKK